MLRAYNEFKDSISRIRQMDAMYLHLINGLHFNHKDVDDLLRNEIVRAISALDRFIHDVVRIGMLKTFLGQRPPTSSYLNFSITLHQLNQINTASAILNSVTTFEATVVNAHKHLAFQEPEKITNALSLIWNEPYKWQQIALQMGLSERDVKIKLKNIVIRRNQIVHEADKDLSTNELQPIRHDDVKNSVDFIESLVEKINALVA